MPSQVGGRRQDVPRRKMPDAFLLGGAPTDKLGATPPGGTGHMAPPLPWPLASTAPRRAPPAAGWSMHKDSTLALVPGTPYTCLPRGRPSRPCPPITHRPRLQLTRSPSCCPAGWDPSPGRPPAWTACPPSRRPRKRWRRGAAWRGRRAWQPGLQGGRWRQPGHECVRRLECAG